MSLRARFALAAGVIVVAVLVVAGVVADATYAHRLRSDADMRLEQLTQLVAGDMQQTSLRATITAGHGPTATNPVLGLEDGTVVSLSPGARSSGITLPGGAFDGAATGGTVFTTTAAGGQTYRVDVTAISPPVSLDGHRLTAIAVASSTAPVDTALRELRTTLLIAGVVAVLVAGLAGWVVAQRAVAPVTDLIAAVERVANDGDLSTRVPAGDSRTEIGRLSEAFNESLMRIEAMYRALETVIVRQRRFVADASHELRTPLTTVSSCLEMVHHFPQMPEDQRATVLDDALHEAQQMARLVDDLLTLASMDSGERLERTPFDWNALLEPAIRDARDAVAPRAVVVDVDATLGNGVGDIRALQQLIGILVRNVAMHTPPAATMTLAVHRAGPGNRVAISVADDGPGVPDAMRDQIFERFVRVDPSRHGEATGLGLAIAKAIAVGHNGDIAATGVDPHGLRVTATIAPLTATRDRRRAPRPRRSVDDEVRSVLPEGVLDGELNAADPPSDTGSPAR